MTTSEKILDLELRIMRVGGVIERACDRGQGEARIVIALTRLYDRLRADRDALLFGR